MCSVCPCLPALLTSELRRAHCCNAGLCSRVFRDNVGKLHRRFFDIACAACSLFSPVVPMACCREEGVGYRSRVVVVVLIVVAVVAVVAVVVVVVSGRNCIGGSSISLSLFVSLEHPRNL